MARSQSTPNAKCLLPLITTGSQANIFKLEYGMTRFTFLNYHPGIRARGRKIGANETS